MPCCPETQLPKAVADLFSSLAALQLCRHVPLMVCERGGRILHATGAFCGLLGRRPEDILGQDWTAMAPGSFDGNDEARMVAALAQGRDWSGEVCRLHADGRMRWVAMSVFPLPAGSAADELRICFATDVSERRKSEAAHRRMEDVLAQALEGDPVPTFVIDENHVITHWNHALEVISGIPAQLMIGNRQVGRAFYKEDRPVLADLIVDGQMELVRRYYPGTCRPSQVVPGAWEAEAWFPDLGGNGRWLSFTAAPLRDAAGGIIGAIETMIDITERKKAEAGLMRSQADLEDQIGLRTAQLAQAKAALEADVERRHDTEQELRRRNAELTELNERLGEAQNQLTQSERLASIGQLAAGVAHEINNPIGYVQSNLSTLETYLQDLFEVVGAFSAALETLPADHPAASAARALSDQRDLDFLREDVPALMAESREGIARVRKIVADLKDFSRVDTTQEWQFANLHQGLDSTLNIVNNEIKYKADVVREYGELPDVECLPSQLNQVFMNLLVNAAHAIAGPERGRITVRTGLAGEQAWVEISDTGKGIAPEHLARIFDPFFTTKPVGKGTGLGLSLSYGIVQKHRGNIEVSSRPGEGSCFRVVLPLRQTREEQAS